MTTLGKKVATNGRFHYNTNENGEGKEFRKLNLSETEINTICELLVSGLPLSDCCKYIGVSVSDFRLWFTNIRENLSDLIDSSSGDAFLKISRSLVDGKIELISLIKNHAKKDWKAAAYLLERLDKNRSVLAGGNIPGGKETLGLEEKKRILEMMRDVENEIRLEEMETTRDRKTLPPVRNVETNGKQNEESKTPLSD